MSVQRWRWHGGHAELKASQHVDGEWVRYDDYLAEIARIGMEQSAAYKKGWDDCARFAAEQVKARLSHNARTTSREAVARNADSITGVQRDALDAILASNDGLTDFDLEDILGRSHQSVSAARNALMMAGLVTDSGERRKNLRGNNAIVWIASSPSRKETHDRTNAHDAGPDGTDYRSSGDGTVSLNDKGLW